jgi:hypothetical protein
MTSCACRAPAIVLTRTLDFDDLVTALGRFEATGEAVDDLRWRVWPRRMYRTQDDAARALARARIARDWPVHERMALPLQDLLLERFERQRQPSALPAQIELLGHPVEDGEVAPRLYCQRAGHELDMGWFTSAAGVAYSTRHYREERPSHVREFLRRLTRRLMPAEGENRRIGTR